MEAGSETQGERFQEAQMRLSPNPEGNFLRGFLFTLII